MTCGKDGNAVANSFLSLASDVKENGLGAEQGKQDGVADSQDARIYPCSANSFGLALCKKPSEQRLGVRGRAGLDGGKPRAGASRSHLDSGSVGLVCTVKGASRAHLDTVDWPRTILKLCSNEDYGRLSGKR